jgi:hypothetical protein
MLRRLGCLALAGTLALALAPRQPAAGPGAPERHAPKAPADPLGDPLPPAAVARLGTLRLVHGGPVSSLAFAGKVLFSAGEDSPLRAWDPATGRETDPPAGQPARARHVASSPTADSSPAPAPTVPSSSGTPSPAAGSSAGPPGTTAPAWPFPPTASPSPGPAPTPSSTCSTWPPASRCARSRASTPA